MKRRGRTSGAAPSVPKKPSAAPNKEAIEQKKEKEGSWAK
jgi:hypothetical protein